MPYSQSASTCFAGTAYVLATRHDSGNVQSATAPSAPMTTTDCTCPHEEEGVDSLESTPRCRVMFCNVLRIFLSFFYISFLFITLTFFGENVSITECVDVRRITYFAKFLLKSYCMKKE